MTPLGDFAKSGLMRLFASTPDIISFENQEQLSSYDWRLRDAEGNNFNFERSKGKVAFVDFWATWHTPSTAELRDIQKLYDDYSGKVDFYMVTNEAQFPVEEFMGKTDYSFPITFRSMDEPSPLEIPDPAGTYLIDKTGSIVVKSKEMTDWYNKEVTQLLDSLVVK
ncbi:Thiol-disulfide isomerase or thioredoxin [Pricia antarctica]|uniref:Thiol-disulfide isomerase or thioredoxin n=2 Tax=Pricia antarctica TaxID=641691 RepID=A0A1G7I9Y4_9FLAO|nr:Thiol-disulfide isomerase or thioredoxin [Pricia antarctica]